LLNFGKKDVDARDKRGHDDGGCDPITSERALRSSREDNMRMWTKIAALTEAAVPAIKKNGMDPA
jgi:hypothetical protein